MTFPTEEYEAPLPIDQLGHTDSITVSVLPGENVNLATIPSSFSQAWASITPEVSVNGVITDFISFTAESQEVIVEGETVIKLYWK